jgi:hypothetical protein
MPHGYTGWQSKNNHYFANVLIHSASASWPIPQEGISFSIVQPNHTVKQQLNQQVSVKTNQYDDDAIPENQIFWYQFISWFAPSILSIIGQQPLKIKSPMNQYHISTYHTLLLHLHLIFRSGMKSGLAKYTNLQNIGLSVPTKTQKSAVANIAYAIQLIILVRLLLELLPSRNEPKCIYLHQFSSDATSTNRMVFHHSHHLVSPTTRKVITK